MNWYKKAQSNEFFSDERLEASQLDYNYCPCCGEDKVKGYASDEWHKCRNTMDCPLSNAGGYFKTEPTLTIEIEGLKPARMYNPNHVKAMRMWASSYKREAGTPNLQIGDVGILVNSQHTWSNGAKVKVIEQHGDDDFTAMTVEPTHEGLYFLAPENITNFENEWLEDPSALVGMTVIVQGQAIIHSQGRQDILTDGKRVNITNYLNDKKLWAAKTSDLEMFSYYQVGASNVRKIE